MTFIVRHLLCILLLPQPDVINYVVFTLQFWPASHWHGRQAGANSSSLTLASRRKVTTSKFEHSLY